MNRDESHLRIRRSHRGCRPPLLFVGMILPKKVNYSTSYRKVVFRADRKTKMAVPDCVWLQPPNGIWRNLTVSKFTSTFATKFLFFRPDQKTSMGVSACDWSNTKVEHGYSGPLGLLFTLTILLAGWSFRIYLVLWFFFRFTPHDKTLKGLRACARKFVEIECFLFIRKFM